MPISAFLLILQVNPYYALVIRGILGAVAVLVYVVLGAADVALTEALVGTLLAIALYVIAIRSSMNLRLGVLLETDKKEQSLNQIPQILKQLRATISKYYLRLEIFPYEHRQELEKALKSEEVHAILSPLESKDNLPEQLNYQTVTRIKRIYDILEPEISPSISKITIDS